MKPASSQSKPQSVAGIVHWVDGRHMVASRGLQLHASDDSGRTWRPLGRVPVSAAQRAKSLTATTRRFFRSHVGHVIPVRDESLLILAGNRFYELDLSRLSFRDQSAQLVGSRPLALARASSTELYYGQYERNRERRPVSVFGSFDGGRTWSDVHEFRGVRHIHGVFHDPFEDCFWMTTGDDDHESALWRTDDRFKTVERVLGGSQQTRAVHLLFNEQYVYFGSDTPREPNFLYRLNRRTGAVEQLQAVGESVFFAAKVGSWLMFSTACEPSPVNTSQEAAVWGSPDGENWTCLQRRRKDFWPSLAMQHGQFWFPAGSGDTDRIWVTALAVEGHGTSWQLELPPVASSSRPPVEAA